LRTRIFATLGLAVVGVLTTAGAALADYPPSPHVKGKTVTPDPNLAFTGTNIVLWVVALIVLLAVGAALIRWARPQAGR